MKELIELLRQSVAIMKSCKDEERTKVDTSKLIKLRDKAVELSKKVNEASRPPQEDVDAFWNDVLTLSKQSEEEIARIKAAKLFTPELAAALKFSSQEAPEPKDTPAPPPHKRKSNAHKLRLILIYTKVKIIFIQTLQIKKKAQTAMTKLLTQKRQNTSWHTFRTSYYIMTHRVIAVSQDSAILEEVMHDAGSTL